METDDEHAAYAAAERFLLGERGQSLRSVTLAGATTLEAHDRLVTAGFRAFSVPIAGPRARDGSARWMASRGLTPDRKLARKEVVYLHGDGGVVRLFLDGGPSAAFDELTPHGIPFARRSLIDEGRTETGWDDEVAAITEELDVVPKGLRAENGVPFDSAQLVESYKLALSVLVEQRIELRPSSWPFPAVPVVEGRGLGAGITLVPQRDFYEIADLVESAARDVGTVAIREHDDDVQIFCCGSDDVRDLLEGIHPAVASITVHRGANVIAIDPVGFEASLRMLVELGAVLLPIMQPVVAYENVSGKDITELLQRRPRAVLASLNAAALTFSAR